MVVELRLQTLNLSDAARHHLGTIADLLFLCRHRSQLTHRLGAAAKGEREDTREGGGADGQIRS